MTRLELKMTIEKEMDNLMKVRELYFKDLEKERINTYEWRKCNALIMWNTKKLTRLRAKWREINSIKKETDLPIGLSL